MTYSFTTTQVATLVRGGLPMEEWARYYLGASYTDYILSKYGVPIREREQATRRTLAKSSRRNLTLVILHLLERDFSEMTLHSIATNESLQCLPNQRSLHYVERSQ